AAREGIHIRQESVPAGAAAQQNLRPVGGAADENEAGGVLGGDRAGHSQSNWRLPWREWWKGTCRAGSAAAAGSSQASRLASTYWVMLGRSRSRVSSGVIQLSLSSSAEGRNTPWAASAGAAKKRASKRRGRPGGVIARQR